MRHGSIFPLPPDAVRGVDPALAESVARWAEREVRARRLEHGEAWDALLAPAIRSLFVDIGLQRLLLPESLGGAGITGTGAWPTVVALLEEVGRADVGIGFLLAGTLAVQSMLPSPPQSRPFTGDSAAIATLILPDYADGPAVSAPAPGGLAYQVAATRADGGFVLSGRNIRPQGAALDAALFAALGDVGGEPGLFLVPADSAGLARGEALKKTGLAASRNADLAFEGVRVSGEALAFAGLEPYRALLVRYHTGLAAVCMGAILAGYEIVKDWSLARVIKGRGQPFKDNPLVASVLGELGTRAARSRLLVHDLARLLADAHPPGAIFPAICGVARTVFADAMEFLNRAMELMASAGYATEWNLERYWRDVKTLEATAGPAIVPAWEMARHGFGSAGT